MQWDSWFGGGGRERLLSSNHLYRYHIRPTVQWENWLNVSGAVRLPIPNQLYRWKLTAGSRDLLCAKLGRSVYSSINSLFYRQLGTDTSRKRFIIKFLSMNHSSPWICVVNRLKVIASTFNFVAVVLTILYLLLNIFWFSYSLYYFPPH